MCKLQKLRLLIYLIAFRSERDSGRCLVRVLWLEDACGNVYEESILSTILNEKTLALGYTIHKCGSAAGGTTTEFRDSL